MDEILELMPLQYYIRECEERKFIFILEGSKEVLESDIPITEEEHTQFLKLQSEGKQFRLKEIHTGEGLFSLIEEYIPEIKEIPQEKGIEDYLLDIEYRVSKMELGV